MLFRESLRSCDRSTLAIHGKCSDLTLQLRFISAFLVGTRGVYEIVSLGEGRIKIHCFRIESGDCIHQSATHCHDQERVTPEAELSWTVNRVSGP